MVLCNIRCVNKISNYLDVVPGKIELKENNIIIRKEPETNETIRGFSTIVQSLLQSSKYPEMLGSNKEIQALTRQWLEYIVVCVNHATTTSTMKRVLKELNSVLQVNTYITGTEKTIADIALYYTLYPVMRELTHQEQAQCVHVSRWFDNIQQEDKVRQQLDLISFNLLSLYL